MPPGFMEVRLSYWSSYCKTTVIFIALLIINKIQGYWNMCYGIIVYYLFYKTILSLTRSELSIITSKVNSQSEQSELLFRGMQGYGRAPGGVDTSMSKEKLR